MTAAAAQTVSQECGKLVGIYFARAASDRELDLVCTYSKADIDILSLQREVADKTQDAGVTRLSLDDKIFVALVIFVIKYGSSGDHELIKGYVRIDHGSDGALVIDQGVHHIAVKRM